MLMYDLCIQHWCCHNIWACIGWYCILVQRVAAMDGNTRRHLQYDFAFGTFLAFIIVMVLCHCHLKRKEKKRYEEHAIHI